MRKLCLCILLCIIGGTVTGQIRFVGLGIRISTKPAGNYYPIEIVYFNSPASVAGMKAGDIIYSIDGISTEHKTEEELLKMLKSNEGNLLTLVFGANKTTAQVKVKLIKGKCLSGNCENGDGKLLDPDSSIYTGHFENGMMKGKGKRVMPQGGAVKSVEGNWTNGSVNGTGILTYTNGDVMTAGFAEGKRLPGDLKIKFKDGGSFAGKVSNDNKIYGSLYTPSNVLIGINDQEFASPTGIRKFYEQASKNPGTYIYAKDDKGYQDLKTFITLAAGNLSECSWLLYNCIKNTNDALSASRVYYLGRRYRGEIVDYQDNNSPKVGANKYLADLVTKKKEEIDAGRKGFDLGFGMDASLVVDIRNYFDHSTSLLKVYNDIANFTEGVGRKQHEFIVNMAENDLKKGTYTRVQDERDLLSSMADLPDFRKHEKWMAENASENARMYQKLKAAFEKLDNQAVAVVGKPNIRKPDEQKPVEQKPVEQMVVEQKPVETKPVEQKTESVNNNGNSRNNAALSELIKRNKPRVLLKFDDKSRRNLVLEDYNRTFAPLLAEREGYSKEVIDRIGKLLNLVPAGVSDEQAEKWKAYEIVNNGYVYLAWVPKDVNLHIEKKFQPADDDGFFVFMIDY